VFHGHVDHSAVGDLYANSDVFVHPGTLPEPFGLTVIEAMQHETVPSYPIAERHHGSSEMRV